MEGELEAYVVDYPVNEASTNEASISEGSTRALAGSSAERVQAFRAEMQYFLRLRDGSRVTLHPGESGALDGMESGERIQVRGYVTEALPMTRDGQARALGQARAAQAAASGRRMRVSDAQPMASRTLRSQATGAVAASHDNGSVEKRRALGMRVEFKDSDESVSREKARKALFDGSKSSNAIYRIASGGDGSGGGQLGILPPSGSGKDTVHVKLDVEAGGCSPHQWKDKAMDKAKSKGVDFSKHQHTVIFLPWNDTGACDWAGLGQFGCRGGSCVSWVRGSGSHVTGHELGHNLGLGHSSRLKGGDKKEYGEWTLMGFHYDLINPVQRENLGFYDDHADKLATVEAGKRTIEIAGLHEPFDGPKPHAVKLPTGDGGTTYYAYLIDEDPGGDTYGPIGSIVVTTPEGAGTLQRTWLTDGDEFKDSDNDILIRVDSRGGNRATLTVRNGDALVAEDTEWKMAPGKKHEGSLKANNAQGRDVTFTQASSASQGNVSIRSDGSFVYTANGNASGKDSFTYRARANGESSKPAEASIAFNQPPTVGSVSKRVKAGNTVRGQLDVTDKESEPGKLALTITEKPQKGTVSLTEGTQFAYEADDGASGEDSFRYRARDSFSSSSEGEVSVRIESDSTTGDGGSGGSDSGGSDDGASGGDSGGGESGGGGGGAVGWLSLLALLGGMLVASRRRLVTLFGGTHA